VLGRREPAVALHEEEARAAARIAAMDDDVRELQERIFAEAAPHARDVAVEHGRKICIGERRVAAHDELRQRQNTM
jgi:hypothetical protein